MFSDGQLQPFAEYALSPPFQSAGGFSWLAQLPAALYEPNPKQRQTVRLYEDGIEVGRGNNSMHVDIRTEGGGLNAFWTGAFCFSASDRSDPNTNGRSYKLVQMVESVLGVWPFAGCTVYNPVYSLETSGIGWNSIRRATLSNSVYSHTPAEHLQLIDFLRGVRDIPKQLIPFCNIVFDRVEGGFAAAAKDTDVVLVEICSDVEVIFRGTVLNRLRIVDSIVEPTKRSSLPEPNAKMLAAAAQRWYFDGLLKESPRRKEYADTILQFHPNNTEQDKLLRDIIAEAYPRKISIDTMLNEVRQIETLIGKPVGVITHTQHYMPDGRGISWPPELHEQIIEKFKKANISVMHPCELVKQHGTAIALKDDHIHWNDNFMLTIGLAVFRFAESILSRQAKPST